MLQAIGKNCAKTGCIRESLKEMKEELVAKSTTLESSKRVVNA